MQPYHRSACVRCRPLLPKLVFKIIECFVCFVPVRHSGILNYRKNIAGHQKQAHSSMFIWFVVSYFPMEGDYGANLDDVVPVLCFQLEHCSYILADVALKFHRSCLMKMGRTSTSLGAFYLIFRQPFLKCLCNSSRFSSTSTALCSILLVFTVLVFCSRTRLHHIHVPPFSGGSCSF